MFYKKSHALLALMFICSATQAYTTDETDILASLDAAAPCQICTSESCPCSESCRCTDACRCRTSGCRGCCEIYTQDQELNKSGTSTCVASYCDCSSGCGQEVSCCSN